MPIKLGTIQVIEPVCNSRGAIVISRFQSVAWAFSGYRDYDNDAMDVKDMNVKDSETILTKIDRQNGVLQSPTRALTQSQLQEMISMSRSKEE